jgi:hypothetical protein
MRAIGFVIKPIYVEVVATYVKKQCEEVVD